MLVVTPAYKNVSGEFDKNPKVLAFRYAIEKLQVLCHSSGGIPAQLKADKRFILIVPALLVSLFWHVLKRSRYYDTVHANWAVCGAVSGVACWITKTPLVTTLRGDDVNSAALSLANRLFLKVAINLSSKIVTVSDDLRKQLIKDFRFPVDKVVTIPNGVDAAFLEKGENSKARVTTQKLTLITIGSLIQRKNIKFVIESLVRLPDHICLKIVGDGREMESLVRLAKDLRLEERIEFLGSQTPDLIPDLIDDSDIFVLCSLSEGRANVIYEAMACGRAIIASDIPGAREQIVDGHTGFLFPVNSQKDFVGLVRRLDEKRSLIYSTGANAYRSILKNKLTWQVAKEKYMDIFHKATVFGGEY